MKYIITEDQLERIKDDILTIPFSHFRNDWDLLQKYINKKGNPPYILIGDVDLAGRENIVSLGSLIEVKGKLWLQYTQIEDLGNLSSVGGDLDLGKTPIKSLGNLTSVGGNFSLYDTPIKSLGNLTSVGVDLDLHETPISKKYTKQQIKDMVEVGGQIYLSNI